MVGTASSAALLAGAVIAAAASGAGTVPDAGVQGAFGGNRVVHIAHVGRIEIDLTSDGGALEPLPCAGAPAGTACYVAPSTAR